MATQKQDENTTTTTTEQQHQQPQKHVVIFETERLTARTMCSSDRDDADFILRLLNSKSWLQSLGKTQVVDHATAAEYIANRPERMFRDWGIGSFALVRKTDGVAVGCAGLYKREELDWLPDLGFAFLDEEQGKGYAYEASLGVLKWGCEGPLRLDHVCSVTSPTNERSLKLLHKLGFVERKERPVLYDKPQVILDWSKKQGGKE